jgi:hypothetical protein
LCGSLRPNGSILLETNNAFETSWNVAVINLVTAL